MAEKVGFMRNILKRTVMCAVIMLLLTLCGCREQVAQRQYFAFDTIINFKFYDAEEEVFSSCYQLCTEMEQKFSRTNPESPK